MLYIYFVGNSINKQVSGVAMKHQRDWIWDSICASHAAIRMKRLQKKWTLAFVSSFWSDHRCPSRGRVAESNSRSERLFGRVNPKDEPASSDDGEAPAHARCKSGLTDMTRVASLAAYLLSLLRVVFRSNRRHCTMIHPNCGGAIWIWRDKR